jgi:copper chaperone CopZ
VLLITGMKDNACREIVTEVLESVNGVNAVQVNLVRASAVVVHEPSCTSADLIAAVGRRGYVAAIASSAFVHQPKPSARSKGTQERSS